MIIFIFTFESLFMCTGADWRAVTGHWTGSRRVGQNFYFPKKFLFFSPHVYTGGINCAVTGRSTLSSGRGLERPTPALCVCMAGGSLDWPLPVARLSQAGGGSRDLPPPCVYVWRGGHSTGRYRSLDSLKPVAVLNPGHIRLAYFMQTLSL